LAYAVATTSRTPTDDDKLDEALEETFPASDAPANTVATGVHLDVESAPSSDIDVQDRREANRFETVVGGQVAYLSYERRPDAIVFLHTEVPESLRGRGIAARLAKAAITSARAEGLRLVAVCPYVRTYLRRHSG
jgi:predicted GNAT family acetyltransferase